jgi:exodeoxyribonuclease III
MSLSVFTLNIANPSPERAQRQVAWLAGRPEDVLVLTETKASQGCTLLAKAFRAAGYAVFDSQPPPGEYGVMIVSRLRAQPDHPTTRLGYLPSRAASCLLPTPDGPLRVVGAYVPSRDASVEKTERKRRWLAEFATMLASVNGQHPVVLAGDLNVLEPDHQPRYRFFASFEYDFYRSLSAQHGLIDAYRHQHPATIEHSWVGRTGDGYRYDHAFCTAALRKRITNCSYDHTPRLEKLSDHSALTIRLDVPSPASLPVTDPTTATAEPTLF